MIVYPEAGNAVAIVEAEGWPCPAVRGGGRASTLPPGASRPRRSSWIPMGSRGARCYPAGARSTWESGMPERWVSVQEVADHLGINKDTVYKWIDARGLPAHRVGRLWKFQLGEIDSWVRSGGAGGPEEPAPSDEGSTP